MLFAYFSQLPNKNDAGCSKCETSQKIKEFKRKWLIAKEEVEAARGINEGENLEWSRDDGEHSILRVETNVSEHVLRTHWLLRAAPLAQQVHSSTSLRNPPQITLSHFNGKY